MTIGTDAGIVELDLIGTRSSRLKAAAAGATFDSVSDDEPWRAPMAGFSSFTVHPRDTLDAYYTPAQYSVIGATGITPWDPALVNSRARSYDWELDRVLSSYIPVSARTAELHRHSHNNVMVRRSAALLWNRSPELGLMVP